MLDGSTNASIRPRNPSPPFDSSARLRLRSDGVYFITLCTVDRSSRFGRVIDAAVEFNAVGRIVDKAWRWLATNYDYVEFGPYVVMPNHLHGIIKFAPDEGGSRTAPTKPARKPLGRLIGAFKTLSTKHVNELL